MALAYPLVVEKLHVRRKNIYAIVFCTDDFAPTKAVSAFWRQIAIHRGKTIIENMSEQRVFILVHIVWVDRRRNSGSLARIPTAVQPFGTKPKRSFDVVGFWRPGMRVKHFGRASDAQNRTNIIRPDASAMVSDAVPATRRAHNRSKFSDCDIVVAALDDELWCAARGADDGIHGHVVPCVRARSTATALRAHCPLVGV